MDTRESCRRAFAILGGTKIAVVSIDVYDHVHWGFEPSGEAWRMYRRIPGELASDFALRSRREAQGWVEAFEREEVLFVIEFTAQDTAAEARKIVDDEQVD